MITHLIIGILAILYSTMPKFKTFVIHPYILFVISPILLSLSHLGFILSLVYKTGFMVTIFRLIFGILMAGHSYLFLYFVAKIFKTRNFSLSIGFILSMEALIRVVTTFMGDILDFDKFMWTSLVFCGFSISATLCLPYIDLSTRSVFTQSMVEQIAEAEPDEPSEIEETGNDKNKIIGFVFFALSHFSVTLCLYLGAFMFPFGYGGHIWRFLYVPHGEAAILNLFREGIYFTQAITSPGIGAFFDIEHDRKISKKYTSISYEYLSSVIETYGLHFFCILFGLFSCLLSSILVIMPITIPKSTFFYLLSAFYGASLSILINGLYSAPWILVRNISVARKTYLYAGIIAILKATIRFSEVLNGYVIQSANVLYPVWYIMIVLGVLLITGSVSCIVYIMYRTKKSVSMPATLAFGDKHLATPMKTQGDQGEVNFEIQPKTTKYRKYLWLLIYFPVDLLIFVSAIIFMIFGSGLFNILLYSFFGKKVYFGSVKIFFLPSVSFLCLVAMRLAFPELLTEIGETIFFRRTRALLGLSRLPTIAEKLKHSSDFTMLTFTLKRTFDLWRYLSAVNVDKTITVVCYPDEVVLEKEEQRFEALSDNSAIDHDEYHREECCNGFILVPKEWHHKNLFSYDEHAKKEYVRSKYRGIFDMSLFNDHFFLGFYGSYCMFFVIPIVYRILLKLLCETCGEVLLFDDNIAALVIVINFIFGFFILIPFVGLWMQISNIIENLADKAVIFKSYALTTFKSKKDYAGYTKENIRKFEIIATHLNQYIFCRCTHIKNILIFSFGSSKVLSVLFSLVTLFVSVKISQEMLQLIFIVIVFELAVLKFIINPAALCTNELRITIKELSLFVGHLCDHIYNENKDPLEKKRLLDVYRCYRDIIRSWEAQASFGFVGFQFRVDIIGIGYAITSDVMRASISTIFLTLIPSILTYFVRLFN